MSYQNGITNGTYTTPIKTYNVSRYVTVYYARMKPPARLEVIMSDEDSDRPETPRSRVSTDENDNGTMNGVEYISHVNSPAQNEMSAPLPELLSNRYPEQIPPVDVVIVGAGLSGLTAAYHLRKARPDIKLVVLEANSHVGGRTLSPMLNTATGTRRFDLGDQWINTEQRNILELLDELNLQTFAEYKEGKNLLLYPDGTTEEFEGNLYPINPLRRLDISSFASRVESMRTDLSKRDPTDLSESLKWDAITLEQFKTEHIWTDAARQVFDALIVFHFGVTPREMSLLFFCHVLNSVGGWKVLFGENDEFPLSRQLKVKGGAQQICENLATAIDRANLRIEDPVTAIDQSDQDFVVVTTESGCLYRARRVIVATSVNQSVGIQHKPNFPLKRESLARLMPSGQCIKYVVTYEQAFWRKNDMSGHVLKLVDEEKAFDNDSDLITYEFIFDACACNRNPNSKSAENPALMGIVYSEAIRQLTPDQREKRLLGKLGEIFGKEALKNIDYAEMDWGVERYTSAFPFSVMTPGAMVYYGKALMKPFGRIHWCGGETASNWYGCMEGSVKSGKRAAQEVKKEFKLKGK